LIPKGVEHAQIRIEINDAAVRKPLMPQGVFLFFWWWVFVASVRIEINDAAVLGAMERVGSRLSDLTPFFQDLGEHLVRRIDDGFRNQTDPYGLAWAPLATSTLKEKKRKKRIQKILQSRGTMRSTLTYQAGRDRLVVGFNVYYAQFHQRGTKRMVKRQLLPDAERGLPAGDVAIATQLLQEHLSR
jgi:phage virion morphogenesis protein